MIYSSTKNGDFVLIAQADPILMATTQSVLLEHGYEVVSATTPEEAMAYCEENPHARVILSDLVFEGSQISGMDLADHARQLCGASAIVTSHYEESLVWGLRGFDKCRYLRQPFTRRAMLAAVGEGWSAPRPGHSLRRNKPEKALGNDPDNCRARAASAVRRNLRHSAA